MAKKNAGSTTIDRVRPDELIPPELDDRLTTVRNRIRELEREASESKAAAREAQAAIAPAELRVQELQIRADLGDVPAADVAEARREVAELRERAAAAEVRAAAAAESIPTARRMLTEIEAEDAEKVRAAVEPAIRALQQEVLDLFLTQVMPRLKEIAEIYWETHTVRGVSPRTQNVVGVISGAIGLDVMNGGRIGGLIRSAAEQGYTIAGLEVDPDQMFLLAQAITRAGWRWDDVVWPPKRGS